MMNIIIGSAGLYSDGFPPSSIPACGVALSVLSDTAEVTVVVTTSVTVLVKVAIFQSSSQQRMLEWAILENQSATQIFKIIGIACSMRNLKRRKVREEL